MGSLVCTTFRWRYWPRMAKYNGKSHIPNTCQRSATGKPKKSFGDFFCYFGESKFPNTCLIGKIFAKKVSLEMTLTCCGQYIWLLVCRGMAIRPLFSSPEWPYRDTLGTNCIDSSRGRALGTSCVWMDLFCPTRVVCKKTRENVCELRFLTQF